MSEFHRMIPPSPWVEAYAPLIPKSRPVLDLACGSGRHSRLLAALGYPVLAVDRDAEALSALSAVPGVTTECMDLEGADWPLAGRLFSGVLVTNYLWRARLPDLLALLEAGGVLIYETFMRGHEAYGKPSNPDFLLQPGELRATVNSPGWRELAFFEGLTVQPAPAMRQAICAVRV